MTSINKFCADMGTVNCPCPLAETGDCIVCSRLAGKNFCDCQWSGVCIYNEFIQNDGVVRTKRLDKNMKILKKIRYADDIMVIVLEVPRGFALEAARPGSFIFVNGDKESAFSNFPVSVMKSDIDKSRIYIALKIISAKTKAVADTEGSLSVRGVYCNGLLGRGLKSIGEDIAEKELRRWLVITKGIGFAPAVNLLHYAEDKVDMDIIIDAEKINQEIVEDYMPYGKRVAVRFETLGKLLDTADETMGNGYDRVMIMASDYYIKALSQKMKLPPEKLVFCNNFRMCCGEGICGACSHTDSRGKVCKMCKCRDVDVKELL